MKRKEGIATLLAGTMIVLALMAVFAVELSQNQAQSRKNLETQAHQRAVLVSGLIDQVFAQVSHPGGAAAAAYGTPTVSHATMQKAKGDSVFVALLAPNGSVIAHSSGVTLQALATLISDPSVQMVMHGAPWSLGNVEHDGAATYIPFVTHLTTAAGPRLLVSAFLPQALSKFVIGEMTKVPGARQQYLTMVDGHHVVIGSTNPARPFGYVFRTASELRALELPSGVSYSKQFGSRYFDRVTLGETPWQLILSAPASEFFASVSGRRHYLPWVIFIAFGLVALVALLLVRRAFRDADRVTLANEQLLGANGQLATAKAEVESTNLALAESNRALERSNEELERHARELVRSNTELDQFASIASHDLQEPLRKVRTFTERVAETEAEVLSERGADYLRRANASAARMQVLIEDLLRYSRVSTQGRPFISVDLGSVVGDVIEDLSEQVKSVGAAVKVGPLPTINADGPQMRQLLQNLISNALKFRRDGVTPEVEVAAKVDGGWVTLTVRDNGIGFDPQYSRRIFRVFERLHGRGAYPGTGIGLALCRKIAERHGGSIVARSVPDEGSTFTVTMQTQRTEAVSDAPQSNEQHSEHATTEEPYVAV